MLSHFMHYPTSLFGEMSRLQREMDHLFGGLATPASIRATHWGTFPAVNVGQTRDRVEISVFLPGTRAESIELSFQDGLLTLAGERETEVPDRSDGVEVYLQERFRGPFKRSIALPEDIDAERIAAQYRNGILQIQAPKRESRDPHRIEVR